MGKCLKFTPYFGNHNVCGKQQQCLPIILLQHSTWLSGKRKLYVSRNPFENFTPAWIKAWFYHALSGKIWASYVFHFWGIASLWSTQLYAFTSVHSLFGCNSFFSISILVADERSRASAASALEAATAATVPNAMKVQKNILVKKKATPSSLKWVRCPTMPKAPSQWFY